MSKNILLIIDAQNDFVQPSGSLYVPGAIQDMTNVINLLKEKGSKFDEILVSIDVHQIFDIGHPCFWVDPDGNHPEPFTTISLDDFNKIWSCSSVNDEKDAEIYLKSLKIQDKEHMIWPEHCVFGTTGSNIFEPLLDELENWTKKLKKTISYVIKGLFHLSEFHGIFGPSVEFPSYGKDAQFNFSLQRFILGFDNIVVTGEAKSHCVGDSLEQLVSGYEHVACEKITILEDCMSNIVGFKHGIFDTLRTYGSEFTLSNTLNLK